MTEEEIKALQDAKEEAERRASEALSAAQAAKAEAEKAKQDVNKIVDELKEERQKKNDALSKLNVNSDALDVPTLVEQALAKKEEERRIAEFEEAVAEFKSSKPEFQNDTAGLVFDKFKTELRKFNFSDVSNKAQAKQRLEEAYRFVKGTTNKDGESEYDGTPRDGQNIPSSDERYSHELNSTLESANISREKFVQLKAKYGDALSGLGIE